MNLLDGKLVSEAILRRLSAETKLLGFQPGLGVVLVGDDAASHLYVSLKERAAERVGIHFEKRLFLENTPWEEIESAILSFNRDEHIDGILVQLPLPPHLSADNLIGLIDPDKDADGFHPENEARLSRGEVGALPVFPRAILELLRSAPLSIRGKRGLVVGNSYRFGDAMCRLLEKEGVSAKHLPCAERVSQQGLDEFKRAEIVVSACGKEGMIAGHMLSPGVVVIDGGIVKNGAHVVGDVDRASVEALEGWLSPVPGGVGPVTVACLLANVVEMAKRRRN